MRHRHIGRDDQDWTTLDGWPDLVHAHRYDYDARPRRTGKAFIGLPWEHDHLIPKMPRKTRRESTANRLEGSEPPSYAAGLRVAFDLMLDARLNPEDTTNA